MDFFKHLHLKIAMLCIGVLLLCSQTMVAYADVTIDSLTYSLNAKSLTATVTGYTDGLTKVEIPESITSSKVEYKVTKIDSHAFYQYSSLKSVTIPNSVTEIGSYSFWGCTSLKSVTIPNSVTEIGDYAFYYCANLTSVTISNSIKKIGSYTFYYCAHLTSVIIPNSVTEIGDNAFKDCRRLTSVTISNNIKKIGSYAFKGCISLTSVTIPNRVTEIGDYAFYDCYSLKIVASLNQTPPSLGSQVFSNGPIKTIFVQPEAISTYKDAKGWNEYNIEDLSYKDIAEFEVDGIFYLVTSFTNKTVEVTSGDSEYSGEIVIPENVTYNDTEYHVSKIGNYAFYYCDNLKSVTIPNSVTVIESYAFRYCSSLKSVTIPNSVTEIEAAAFCDCSSLKNVTIPNSVMKIGANAFRECTGLIAVVIGSSVTSIGDNAFWRCGNLSLIVSKALVPPVIQARTFGDCYGAKLVVVSLDYETAEYWKNFSNISVLTTYEASGTTFEIDGFKYEIASLSDQTCRLYGLDESVVGEHVVIPESVEYMNRKFTPIEIKGTLLNGESAIKTVTIPSCITTISDGIIFNSSLEKLTICSSVISDILCACSVEELVVTPSSNRISTDLQFNRIGKITIEDGETPLKTSNIKCEATSLYLGRSVSANTFSGMTSLEDVILSDKLSTINESVFSDCSGLTSVVIPNSVTSIGSSSFEGCSGLTTLSIPNSVVSIGNSAFSGCSGLTSVVIPNSVTKIDAHTFAYCSGLTSVVIPNSTTLIGSYAFSGCDSLTSVAIPNSVVSIGNHAFSGCVGLNELTIPSSVTTIDQSAFEGCTGSSKLVFEDGPEKLFNDLDAFKFVAPKEVYFGRQMDFPTVSCTELEIVEFGESVHGIDKEAFIEGNAIRTVISHNPIPPTSNNADIFSSRTYLEGVLYVPEASIEAYQAANGWKLFWEVKPISDYSGVEEIVPDNDAPKITLEPGTISVSTRNRVRIVTITGTTIYEGFCNCRVNVESGIYIVIIGNTNYKVLVK